MRVFKAMISLIHSEVQTAFTGRLLCKPWEKIQSQGMRSSALTGKKSRSLSQKTPQKARL